jgi:retinol dehydrogenase 12
VLVNNAGVLNCPAAARTAQGHQAEMGTNCLGHLLLTELLTPALARAAGGGGVGGGGGSARVVWTSSFGVDVAAPRGGMDLEEVKARRGPWLGFERYAISKAGNYFHAIEYAREHRGDGIISMVSFPVLSPVGRPPTVEMTQRLLCRA